MVRVMQGWELLAVEWSFVVITLFMVITRLYVQLSTRRHVWREVLTVAAWLGFVAVAICDCIQNDRGGYNLVLGLDKDHDSQVFTLKTEFAQGFFYKTSIYCCKASLLFFYSDLSPRHMYFKTWLLIVVTGVLCVAGTLVHIFLNFFKCAPMSLNWDTEDHSCGYTKVYFATSWAFHLGTDILVYAIPFLILRHMRNLSMQQKLGAALMFGVGFINIVTAALLLAFSLYSTDDLILQGFHNVLFIIQQATAILVVCLPQMRLFLKKTSADIASRRGTVQSNKGSKGGSWASWGGSVKSATGGAGSRKGAGRKASVSDLEKGSLFEDTVIGTKVGGLETTVIGGIIEE